MLTFHVALFLLLFESVPERNWPFYSLPYAEDGEGDGNDNVILNLYHCQVNNHGNEAVSRRGLSSVPCSPELARASNTPIVDHLPLLVDNGVARVQEKRVTVASTADIFSPFWESPLSTESGQLSERGLHSADEKCSSNIRFKS